MDKVDDNLCNECLLHEDEIRSISFQMPDNALLNNVAEFLKLMSDSTRIKILYCLSKYKLCVLDIATIIGMTHSAVSHQLKILKLGRLVKSEKKGKEVYYSLDDTHIEEIFKCSFEHIKEDKSGREK